MHLRAAYCLLLLGAIGTSFHGVSGDLSRHVRPGHPRGTYPPSSLATGEYNTHSQNFGSNITHSECYGPSKQSQLEQLISGEALPYAFVGPQDNCTAEGCKHGYWKHRSRFKEIDAYKGTCKPELRQKTLTMLTDWAKRGAEWAQDAILAKPCKLWPFLKGRTVWVMGDSLSLDFADALVGYMTEYHVYEDSQIRPITNDSSVLKVLRAEIDQTYDAWCHSLEAQSRICFVRVMRLLPRLLDILPVLPSIMDPQDVVILNAGLHYNQMDNLVEELSVVEPPLREFLQSTKVKMIWRQTTPQHFDSPMGSFVLGDLPTDISICKPLAGEPGVEKIIITTQGTLEYLPGSSEVEDQQSPAIATILGGGSRNLLTQPFIDRLGLPVFPVWNQTAMFWEYHPSNKDCTHFCAPTWAHLQMGALPTFLSHTLDTEIAYAL